MKNKSQKIKQALLSQEKPGVRFVRENKELILEQLQDGYSAAAIYRAFKKIGDEPPIKLRAFEYHLKKLKPAIQEKPTPPTPLVREKKKSLNWDATDTGKEIE